MKKLNLKKVIKGTVYTATALTLVLSIALITKTDDLTTSKEDDNFEYVNRNVVSNNIPVISENTDATIIKPYTSEKVEIFKKFYDKDSTDDDKKNSLIYYNDTYMQNSGILYKSSENFDVISILDGEVIDVKTDEILGNVVEIKHSNNLISIYQGLSEVTVKKSQTIKSGEIIGKSGKLEFDEQIENGLLFELLKDSKYVNPLNYFDKKLNEI